MVSSQPMHYQHYTPTTPISLQKKIAGRKSIRGVPPTPLLAALLRKKLPPVNINRGNISERNYVYCSLKDGVNLKEATA